MNDMAEINAFYDWQDANRLTPSAICLWHALMNIANRARWPEDFSVAISTLRSKTHYSKDSIYTARNLLKQKGRINFKEGKGSGAAIYRLNPLVTGNPTQIPPQNPPQIPTQPPIQYPNMNILDYTRLNETYISGGGESARGEFRPELSVEAGGLGSYAGMTAELAGQVQQIAWQLLGKYFGRQSTEQDEILLFDHIRCTTRMPDGTWQATLNPDKLSVIEYAFRTASGAGVHRWDYVERVLQRCAIRRLTTMDACERFDAQLDFDRTEAGR